jgi:hypothetical protein
LTSFYLSIAFGGALGGVAVGVVAPLAFVLYQELHLGVLACCVLYVATLFGDRASRLYRGRPVWASGGAVLALVALALLLSHQTSRLLDGARSTRRNFFGMVRVQEVGRNDPAAHALKLWDGAIMHGYQFQRQDLQRVPTIYYTTGTGGGATLERYRREGVRRIGVIGLGVGTLAAYGRPGDTLRFYEINPNVVELATNEFTFLAGCPATWEIVLGDARLKLEEEPDQNYDVLILDAFSSDSIPVHLLTIEAFELYARHLAPAGVIAVNTSNLHLDLSAMVYRLAETAGFFALEVDNKHDPGRGTVAASWMVLSRETAFLRELAESFGPQQRSGQVVLTNRPGAARRGIRPWTDNYSNLLQILK